MNTKLYIVLERTQEFKEISGDKDNVLRAKVVVMYPLVNSTILNRRECTYILLNRVRPRICAILLSKTIKYSTLEEIFDSSTNDYDRYFSYLLVSSYKGQIDNRLNVIPLPYVIELNDNKMIIRITNDPYMRSLDRAVINWITYMFKLNKIYKYVPKLHYMKDNIIIVDRIEGEYVKTPNEDIIKSFSTLNISTQWLGNEDMIKDINGNIWVVNFLMCRLDTTDGCLM